MLSRAVVAVESLTDASRQIGNHRKSSRQMEIRRGMFSKFDGKGYNSHFNTPETAKMFNTAPVISGSRKKEKVC